ncbi:hypothetical protein [Mycobacterium sp. SMC-4]|uniref:hypothetical protein n=1 Tax=Mycobacterium sp. SMC-4 TaxID=2857059 RepID=UPI003CFBCF82
MNVAVNSVIASGVALVGAGVIAIAPVEAPVSTVREAEPDVSLTASSLAYVPINLIESVFSAPAHMVEALNRLSAALTLSGSWNESSPNNVWGWDPANPAMLRAAIDVLIPFPAFSNPWGKHLDWWATANLPMYEGCAFECPDLPGMLDVMFNVPMSHFYREQGYTFPTVINPIDGKETEWSGDTIKLDPAETVTSVWNFLTSEPQGIQRVTFYEIIEAVADFAASLQVTGHLPDWIAVREIERFFKFFVPAPPAEEAGESEEDEAARQSLPEVEVTTLAAADKSATEAPAESPVSTPRRIEVRDAEVGDAADDEAPAVDGSATEETTPAPGEQTTDEPTDEEPEKVTVEEQPAAETGGKHRKSESDESSVRRGGKSATTETGGRHRKAEETKTSSAKTRDRSDSGSDD